MTKESTVAEREPEAVREEAGPEANGDTMTIADPVADPMPEETVLDADDITAEATDGAADDTPSDAQVIETLRTELAAAEAKADDLLDKLQRTAAEYQNSRRRQEKQLADEIERASGHIIQRLLPVVDDLELAFSNLPSELDDSQSAWIDGFRQIRKKLASLLEDQGVTAIAQSGEFDPSRHEAVSSEPNETVESNHIIQTLRTGYEYKGRVLRPALVRVAV